MNEEILKLAKECGIRIHKYNDTECHMISNELLEAFYRAAFNAGIEAAANACNKIAKEPSSLWEEVGCWEHSADNCAFAIRSLEMKP